jgi:hypothetical protein
MTVSMIVSDLSRWVSRLRELGSARPAAAIAIALSSSSGCTMMLETSQSQCDDESDCLALFGASAPFECVASMCVRPACSSDLDCRNRQGSFVTSICDEAQHQCVEAACLQESDCTSGTTCDLGTNRCVERQCVITDDCMTPDRMSPTVECVAGFCVDEKWGCIGKPDDRTRVPGETGTLEIPLLNALTQTPLSNAAWQVRVCKAPELDLNCEHPIATAPPPVYDAASGIMTVAGLDPDLPIRIFIDEPAHPDVIPMEFISQKSAVGVTRVPSLGFATLSGLLTLVSSYKLPGSGDVTFASVFRTGMGTGYGTVFDCTDRPTAQVQVKFNTPDGAPVAGYNPYFFDEQLVAYPGYALPPPYDGPIRPFTFGTGIFSALNLPPNQLLSVRTNLIVDERSEQPRVIREAMSVSLQPSRRTTMHLYPRDYTPKLASP